MESDARRLRNKKAFEEEDFRKCLTVPDCVVKMIMSELTRRNISWIIPPAEADAQLAFLQVFFYCYKRIYFYVFLYFFLFLQFGVGTCCKTKLVQANGVLDVIIVSSNDSDFMVYPNVRINFLRNVLFQVQKKKKHFVFPAYRVLVLVPRRRGGGGGCRADCGLGA